ncbi:MAG: DUF885 domain-containing protein [Planctomycetales bacterium]|nr:DUF885 domain-containing protein [Planctomycetales bacterium]
MLRKVFCQLIVVWISMSAGSQCARGDATADFHKLVDEIWEFGLNEDPLFATSVGDHRADGKLPEVSLAASARRHAADEQFQSRLAEIPRGELPPREQVNYDILARQLREGLAEYEFGSHLTPITSRSGFHIEFPDYRNEAPLATTTDYENYIARLRAFDAYARGYIELLRAGVRTEQTLPAVILSGWEDAVEAHMVDDPTKSLFYEPLENFPATVPAAQQERLRSAAQDAIRGGIVAGYAAFRDFMRDEYVPAARGSIGASALPRGRDFYRHRVKLFTTLDVTPEEVHRLGEAEVARIRGEMEAIVEQVGFDGNLDEFFDYLRTEPKFYAESPEELMKEAAAILKHMDGELPTLFGKLPRMPYGLRPVPGYIAPRTSSAYYMRPTGDGTKAGFFYINTFNLKSRPLYALESLALHEAVPGHHLQLALQQEMGDLPNFRRYSNFTAFIEGWALYAERLGLEVGMYQDPYSNFGRLSMEMWRACRLVVDTGIHYFGWTRQQAIDYMKNNSALSLHNIEAEVDRYIGWPGQALAYKAGELKISALRKQAEQSLGSQFDVRAFHDVVLGGGAVPLDVLENNVNAWIERQRSASAAQ